MKHLYVTFIALLFLSSCLSKAKQESETSKETAIEGTWKLISGMQISGQDTSFIDYTEGQEMIKLYNDTHFAFLRHDLNQGRDSSALYVSGGGRYEIMGNILTEHLDYCTAREWENHSFELSYEISGDTLTTSSVEKVEEAGVDRLNIEKLVRVN